MKENIEALTTNSSKVYEKLAILEKNGENIKNYIGQDQILLTAKLDVYALANHEEVLAGDPERMDAAVQIQIVDNGSSKVLAHQFLSEFINDYTFKAVVILAMQTEEYKTDPLKIKAKLQSYSEALHQKNMQSIDEYTNGKGPLQYKDEPAN